MPDLDQSGNRVWLDSELTNSNSASEARFVTTKSSWSLTLPRPSSSLLHTAGTDMIRILGNVHQQFSVNSLVFLWYLFFISSPYAETLDTADPTNLDQSTIESLSAFAKLRNELQQDINILNIKIRESESEAEKNALKQELNQRRADLAATDRNFENVAAGIDISSLRSAAEVKFNLQEEIMALLKPAIDEMKEMTSHVRQKSELKEKIAFYEERLPIIDQALENVSRLQLDSSETLHGNILEAKAATWRKQRTFMLSELQAAKLQLNKIVSSEVSLTEASQSYLKEFFQQRGLFLTQALGVVIGIIFLSKISHAGMQRFIPGFSRQHRSFRIRLVELFHRIVTILLIIAGPMVVFYINEDWVLFSLGILLLLGIGLTLRQALPRYWHQIQLFLNIGAVREGERIIMGDMPWRIEKINYFCTLSNPVAELSQRVPIAELVDLKSRPHKPDEPWFPCQKGDWVILNDGVRGKVIGISPELISLVERGGAHITYQTGNFLGNSPRNLATNFRIKEFVGISYSLQSQSTKVIPEILHNYILQRAEEEGYREHLLNLRVEFALANSSSLDLAVIADFKGDLSDLYNRLRRAIQRWFVDACTENDWEIPFPQMTLHGAVSMHQSLDARGD